MSKLLKNFLKHGLSQDSGEWRDKDAKGCTGDALKGAGMQSRGAITRLGLNSDPSFSSISDCGSEF